MHKVVTMESCACCGYQNLDEKGNFEICKICFWEDDPVQESDPWFENGANKLSLFESQQNYKKFGAVEKRFINKVNKPTSQIKGSGWRELTEEDKEYRTTPNEIEEVWGTEKQTSYNYWERNA